MVFENEPFDSSANNKGSLPKPRVAHGCFAGNVLDVPGHIFLESRARICAWSAHGAAHGLRMKIWALVGSGVFGRFKNSKSLYNQDCRHL